jgi:ABC-2 type transport system ATP-binding protein
MQSDFTYRNTPLFFPSQSEGEYKGQIPQPDPNRDDSVVQSKPQSRETSRRTAPARAAKTDGALISAEHVDYLFSSDLGVHDLTFQVPPGVIFGLVGPSGCGKTTTVRLLSGMYAPTHGRLAVLGEEPHNFTGKARENIGYLAQHLTLYPMLTVKENLNFVASLYGMGILSRRKRLKSLLKFVELYDARDRLASKLSGGMQRRLQLACALAHNPRLIFADEPTAGTDPVLRGKFWEHFRSLRDEGHTLFVTTQYIGEIEHCDVVGIMQAGRLLFVDTPEGLRRRAFGGDVIRLAVEPSRALEAVQLLNAESLVSDAATAMPQLIAALQDHKIDVQEVERYVAPFDDVFIELMKQAGDERTGGRND